MTAFVEIDDVTRQWDGKGGVRAVSMTVGRGAFVSILGPSGCGKSTLLRLIAGLERPSAGRIRIDGEDVTHRPPAQRRLSLVFQSYALFPHLTVRDNILFGMKVRRAPRALREEKLAEAAGMMGLTEFLGRKPAQLSGGQRQRVALARTVVSGHPLVLMDEPLSNLDAKLRTAVRRDIKALQQRLDLTVVYVTHDQGEAMSLSDHIVLMRDAAVVQAGSPQALYAHPATPFAAEFIGDPPMALLDGSLLGVAGPTTVGIRVEHLSVAPLETADLVAEVEVCEFLGADTRVLLRRDRARGLALHLPGAVDWPQGRRVGLHLPSEHRFAFAGEPFEVAGPTIGPATADRPRQPS
ncbi:MAG: ATP-binding cassette domain-containing protein [Alphaproteobacteria bacterium]|jgi:sn-glycerol 3-phosphate transport system ATP-binding protein|nr:ATP-binding cassette domain-containing protein [Alphaproteobacteria bacterium]